MFKKRWDNQDCCRRDYNPGMRPVRLIQYLRALWNSALWDNVERCLEPLQCVSPIVMAHLVLRPIDMGSHFPGESQRASNPFEGPALHCSPKALCPMLLSHRRYLPIGFCHPPEFLHLQFGASGYCCNSLPVGIFFFLPSESPTPTMASCMPLMTTKQVRVLSGKKTRGHCSLYLLSLKILLFFLDCFTDTYIISGSKNSHVIRYL